MSDKTLCQHCAGDTSHAGGIALCAQCQRTTRSALGNVISYHADLLTVGVGPSGMKIRSEHSDPTGRTATATLSDPIEEAAANAKAVLVGWVNSLLDDRPMIITPHNDLDSLAKTLAHNVKTIATLAWAGAMVHDIVNLEHRLRRIIEANKARWYAGVCGWVQDTDHAGVYCTRVLYADPESGFVKCPVCRTSWPVKERRRILLDQAREEITNVATIARALVALLDSQPSQAKLEKRIQNWIDRGLIERRGSLDIDGHVRKVYRLGDVLDRLTDDIARRSA